MKNNADLTPTPRVRTGPDRPLPTFNAGVITEEYQEKPDNSWVARMWRVALNIAWWNDIFALVFTLNPEPLIKDNWMVNILRRRR